jgi:hypothetical protein
LVFVHNPPKPHTHTSAPTRKLLTNLKANACQTLIPLGTTGETHEYVPFTGREKKEGRRRRRRRRMGHLLARG